MHYMFFFASGTDKRSTASKTEKILVYASNRLAILGC